jgi:3-hydroxy-9,10-secoandrosta-1,3,5(10)-triene-9,17-dione monooxygenase reductase component
MITPRTFTDMMASLAASVTIVTVDGADGPSGLTVSAFTSVSADPPIVLACIDSRAATLGVLHTAEGFTVNFLPRGAEDIAMLFATRDSDRFGTTEWHSVDVGGPVLEDAYGHFVCRTIERLEMGDHWVIFGEVVSADRDEEPVEPLVYHDRRFVEIAERP